MMSRFIINCSFFIAKRKTQTLTVEYIHLYSMKCNNVEE